MARQWAAPRGSSILLWLVQGARAFALRIGSDRACPRARLWRLRLGGVSRALGGFGCLAGRGAARTRRSAGGTTARSDRRVVRVTPRLGSVRAACAERHRLHARPALPGDPGARGGARWRRLGCFFLQRADTHSLYRRSGALPRIHDRSARRCKAGSRPRRRARECDPGGVRASGSCSPDSFPAATSGRTRAARVAGKPSGARHPGDLVRCGVSGARGAGRAAARRCSARFRGRGGGALPAPSGKISVHGAGRRCGKSRSRGPVNADASLERIRRNAVGGPGGRRAEPRAR